MKEPCPRSPKYTTLSSEIPFDTVQWVVALVADMSYAELLVIKPWFLGALEATQEEETHASPASPQPSRPRARLPNSAKLRLVVDHADPAV